MSRHANPSAHLFPSAIICSCGERFNSDWSDDDDENVGSALYRYLLHTTQAITGASSSIKPHRIARTLVTCLLCKQSVGLNRYRAHLAESCGGGVQAAIRRYRLAATPDSSDFLPSLECVDCLLDDRFHCVDVGTTLEHRHPRSDPDNRDPAWELYVTCRLCPTACRVPVDSAIAHATLAHRDRRLDEGVMTVADVFFSAPQMRRGWFDSAANSDDKNVGFALADPDPEEFGERPQRAFKRVFHHGRQSIHAKRERFAEPYPIGGDLHHAKRRATQSLFHKKSRVDEEMFSEQLVDAMCGDDVDTRATPPAHQLTVTASSGSRCDKLRPMGLARLASEALVVGEIVQECDECGKSISGADGGLVMHKRVHREWRSLVCADAGDSFAHESTRRIHEHEASAGPMNWMRKRSDGEKGARQSIGLGDLVWVDKNSLQFAVNTTLKGTYGSISWANYVRQLAKALMWPELCLYVVKGRIDRKSRFRTRPIPKELLHAIYSEVEKRQKEKWEENEKNPPWNGFANFQVTDINRALAQVFLEARNSAAKAARD